METLLKVAVINDWPLFSGFWNLLNEQV